MDWIRAPYRSMMRVVGDDTGQAFPVQWYFARPDAHWFPFETPFVSNLWDKDLGGGEVLGEDPLSIRFHSDAGVTRGPGRLFCGDERQWRDGCSSIDPIPPRNNLTGLPCCCGPAPRVARFTMLDDGAGEVDTNYILQQDGSRILQQDRSTISWR